jgi:hypothetical protein
MSLCPLNERCLTRRCNEQGLHLSLSLGSLGRFVHAYVTGPTRFAAAAMVRGKVPVPASEPSRPIGTVPLRGAYRALASQFVRGGFRTGGGGGSGLRTEQHMHVRSSHRLISPIRRVGWSSLRGLVCSRGSGIEPELYAETFALLHATVHECLMKTHRHIDLRPNQMLQRTASPSLSLGC